MPTEQTKLMIAMNGADETFSSEVQKPWPVTKTSATGARDQDGQEAGDEEAEAISLRSIVTSLIVYARGVGPAADGCGPVRPPARGESASGRVEAWPSARRRSGSSTIAVAQTRAQR